jgi:hypothetical protein
MEGRGPNHIKEKPIVIAWVFLRMILCVCAKGPARHHPASRFSSRATCDEPQRPAGASTGSGRPVAG